MTHDDHRAGLDRLDHRMLIPPESSINPESIFTRRHGTSPNASPFAAIAQQMPEFATSHRAGLGPALPALDSGKSRIVEAVPVVYMCVPCDLGHPLTALCPTTTTYQSLNSLLSVWRH